MAILERVTGARMEDREGDSKVAREEDREGDSKVGSKKKRTCEALGRSTGKAFAWKRSASATDSRQGGLDEDFPDPAGAGDDDGSAAASLNLTVYIQERKCNALFGASDIGQRPPWVPLSST
eukprot:scaffold2475_cov245-Pinguiococcus_pyrenoidosus.AAC.2